MLAATSTALAPVANSRSAGNKVYWGCIRRDGGYFTPANRFDDLHWMDEALRARVLSLWHEGALEANAHSH